MDLEGLVAKHGSSPYIAELAANDGFKIKNQAYSQMAGREKLFRLCGFLGGFKNGQAVNAFLGVSWVLHLFTMRHDCKPFFVAFLPYCPEIAYQLQVCPKR
jgi:hypothetical protein